HDRTGSSRQLGASLFTSPEDVDRQSTLPWPPVCAMQKRASACRPDRTPPRPAQTCFGGDPAPHYRPPALIRRGFWPDDVADYVFDAGAGSPTHGEFIQGAIGFRCAR